MVTNHDPFVGKVIDGRYEIQARIGEGGMGVVYKARQTSIDRIIALKMLNQQMANDPTWVQRFYNEAKACSRLQHPNTIRMFDFGQTQDSRLFMTMEFLDGHSLRAVLTPGPIAPQRVAKILIQCCASLAEAHSIGIIHRDIKPDNVFLLNMAGSPDFVKLLDFSVAKLLEGDRMKTQAGVVFGTPQYMSPEQGRGLPLDARSDLYALGILAFEMLTGNVPFHDDNPMTVIQMHLHAGVPPMPETVPYSIQQVVRRALEKDAGRRYQSAGEMMQQCQAVFAELSGGGVSVGGGGVPRTMVAQPNPHMMQGMPPQQMNAQMPGMGMPPHMQQGMPQQMNQGYGQPPQQSSAAAKTMVAGQSPFAGGQMPPQQASGLAPGQPQPGPGGFVSANPMQKTIVAGMAPPIVQGQMMQPGMPGMQPNAIHPNAATMPQGIGGPGQQQQQQQGPNKTVMLQPSEGVVSVARTNQPIQPAAGGETVQQGASTLFWIVSLFIGIAIGALAYVIVLQTQ
ncbi:MAG: protein kinase [Deltaproteobacteria bacterium]|nr:protein kinase [Deltaproteobacteria bacterium]